MPRAAAFVHAAVDLCHQYGARVLVNGDPALAAATGADGVHLPAGNWRRKPRGRISRWSPPPAIPRRNSNGPRKLGCDFAVFGAVRTTASHPGVAGIGWEGLAAALAVPPLPTFALGGLSRGGPRCRPTRRRPRHRRDPRRMELSYSAASGSGLGSSFAAIRYWSEAHAPRSTPLQRAEQNGR
jgi:hypothetical protein